MREAEAFSRQLTAQQRITIVALKLAYWNTPRYRDSITSALIYEAVVQHGVTNRDAFEQFVQSRQRP